MTLQTTNPAIHDLAQTILNIVRSNGIEDIEISNVEVAVQNKLIPELEANGSFNYSFDESSSPLRMLTNADLEFGTSEDASENQLFIFLYDPGTDSTSPYAQLQKHIAEVNEQRGCQMDNVKDNRGELFSLSYFSSSDYPDILNLKSVMVYYIVQNRDSYKKYPPKKAHPLRAEIQKYIKAEYNNAKLSLTEISFERIFVPKTRNSDTLTSIRIDSRIRSLETEHTISTHPDEYGRDASLILKGMVYTADLQDVVNLYSLLGDTLFDNNLRYQVKNQNNVNDAISDTLDQNQGMFWFLNNGISMIVSNYSRLRQDLYDRISIQLPNPEAISLDIVSIINGAQTITSCFGSTSEVADEKVLFRLYSFLLKTKQKDGSILYKDLFNKATCESLKLYGPELQKVLDNITIALNRQKPIRAEDLAFTSELVRQINSLPENFVENDKYTQEDLHNFWFEITRRGDKTSNYLHKYSLILLSRVVKAYCQEPGGARSKASTTLLKLAQTHRESDDAEFADNTVFVQYRDDDDLQRHFLHDTSQSTMHSDFLKRSET
ncbi:hypothetical protein BPY_09210 [Bifidobacterium psychraerophilum]|uniref:AIPR family protein n=1 Tax=Bifidobacterium psychraerophilum TaxID=218140 RepID=UPI0031154246